VDEIVGRDGRFGAIATSTAVPALADAIDRALAASAHMDRAAMRAHVEANYAAPAVARRAIEAYEGLMVQARRQRRGVPAGRAAEEASETEPGDATADDFRLPLVLALARGQAIERVALLPADLRDRLTIVTSPRGRYADDRELPVWGDWLELDQERFYRDALAALEQSTRPAGGFGRLKAALRGPNIERLRKDLAARKDDVGRDGTQRFLETAATRIPSVGGHGTGQASRGSESARWIVALDADDILLAGSLGAAIGPVAPGGLRWLADAWDAADRPT